MKETILLIVFLPVFSTLHAQVMDTVRINYKPKKFNAKEHILLMFETFDTTDADGKKNTIGRYYYFDKKQRIISSVREYYNFRKREHGRQVFYTFGKGQLVRVTVIPPKSLCEKCASEYFFSGDTISFKKEFLYSNDYPKLFLAQARYFQSKLPRYLPWGYFEEEVIVNGKMKRLRRSY
jgi:hypothetical protein